MKRAGTLAVSNTTINYTKKLPAASEKVCTLVGGSLTADGGALFIKLIKGSSNDDSYIGNKDKVKVTLTNVTATFTGKEDENKGRQSQDYGIYEDGTVTVEDNLVVSGDVSVTDKNFVRFTKAAGPAA